jgi:hypothetical protein
MQRSSFPAGFQWHWKTHLEWAAERLVFIFFKFHPTYDRLAAMEGLQALMADQQVLSYAFYELSAPHDVLVRAWLPTKNAAARLPRALEAVWPTNEAPEMSVVLEVEKIWHHWPWQETDLSEIGAMESPETEVMKKGRPARELDALNEIQAAASLASSSLTAGTVERSRRAGDPKARKLVNEYKHEHLITEPPYDPGVRFLILVEAGKANQNRMARDRLGRNLGGLLNEAQNNVRGSSPRIWDRSLYSTFGDGDFPFLILGRVDEAPGHFHSIGNGLVATINERLAAAGARTHTSYFLQPGFLDFRDELRVPSRPLPRAGDAAELLERQESSTFEVKGSAFAELSDYFNGKVDQPLTPTDVDSKPLASLLRAVLSLLNSGEEGQIVIGAVEEKKYPKSQIVKALPRVGNFKVCGIELDLKGQDWDRYARRLEQALEARITPDPMRWIRLSPSAVGDNILCAISISLPDEFYEGEFRAKSGAIEDHFIVRGSGAGASTKRLKSMAEITKHMRHTRRAQRRLEED